MKNPDTGFKRIISAARFSKQGLVSAYRHEAAFRQEVWATVVLVPIGLYLGYTSLEKIALAGVLFLLLIVELLNSAIEAVVDRFGDEYHELAGRAKDMGSAAVILTLILSILVWLTILLT